MSTTRPRKDSTILAPIDIADQPVGRYIFLTEGSGGTQAFSVDNIEVQEEVVRGVRFPITSSLALPILVIAVPVRSPWTVIARDSVLFRTLEESMQKQKTDQEQTADLMKSVFGGNTPEGTPPVTPPVVAAPVLGSVGPQGYL
jgi:hypothetical protein